MCMAVYICIHICKGHSVTEAKIPTIVASDVCCFCRVQRFVAGLPFVAKSLHELFLLFFRVQRATSLILCDRQWAACIIYRYICLFIEVYIYKYVYENIHMHTHFHTSRFAEAKKPL